MPTANCQLPTACFVGGKGKAISRVASAGPRRRYLQYNIAIVNLVKQKILPFATHCVKVLANKRDLPYQSLLKVLPAERLKQEEATQVLILRPI
jgi:hypothetical protein